MAYWQTLGCFFQIQVHDLVVLKMLYLRRDVIACRFWVQIISRSCDFCGQLKKSLSRTFNASVENCLSVTRAAVAALAWKDSLVAARENQKHSSTSTGLWMFSLCSWPYRCNSCWYSRWCRFMSRLQKVCSRRSLGFWLLSLDHWIALGSRCFYGTFW